MQRTITPGIYVPTLSFFKDDESLDLETLRHHISRVAQAGIAGIVTLGSNGEAAHLDVEERIAVTRTTRETLDKEGYGHFPIIVGASAQSARETIKLCRDAATAGGSHVLVLPPCYFRGAMTEEAIYNFYIKVADGSPLPLVLYSFPAVVTGIEMSSDLLVRVSAHPNVVGTKFTCGDTGKLARVARAMTGSEYATLGGLADFELQAFVAGASGAIVGGGNVTPKACVKVFQLFKEEKYKEAMELQSLLAAGDWHHTSKGIGATKAALEKFFSYGGSPRSPLTSPPEEVTSSIATGMDELIQLENSL